MWIGRTLPSWPVNGWMNRNVSYFPTPNPRINGTISSKPLERDINVDVEIFALCDAATDSAGKLNILGAFDKIGAQKLPVVYPRCSVALRIRFERIEQGMHRIRINVVDADGQPIMAAFDNEINVSFPGEIQSLCANIVLQINGLKFEKLGQYAIDMAIDGRHEKSLPVYVLQMVKPKPLQPDPGQEPT